MAFEKPLEYDEQIKPRTIGHGPVVVHHIPLCSVDDYVRRTLVMKRAICQRTIKELEKRRAADH